MKNLSTYLIALLSGGAGVLAFAPYDQWGLAYLSVLGLIYTAKTREKFPAFLGTFLWSLSFFTLGTSWLHVTIHRFGGAPLWLSYFLIVVLAAYLSLYPLLFTYLVRRFRVQSAVIFAAIWTLTEFLRGRVLTGFPWLQFGYSQIDSPFAGIAPIFGVNGLTFFTIWAAATLFNLFNALITTPRQWAPAAVDLALLVAVGLTGAQAGKVQFVKNADDKALTITLAQGNIAQNLKWDPEYLNNTLAIYSRLIRDHLGKADVIVLPESALPALENELQPYFDALRQTAAEHRTELLIGTVYYDERPGKLLNSIVHVDGGYQAAAAARYNKHHLVPFGEYVPLENLLRPLGSVFNLPMSAFQAGAAQQAPLAAQGRYFTAAVCYEIIFGDLLQRNLRPQTDFLLTVSNDAWFGDSLGPWQHLQMARMRALELGKPLIRATNTGISVFVNAQGQIIARAPQFTETTLTRRIAPTVGDTPYAVLGDKPLYLLALLFVLLRGVGALIKRKLAPQA